MLWHSLTGYWAAGIRALAERAEVTVLARPPDQLAPYDYAALELNGAEYRSRRGRGRTHCSTNDRAQPTGPCVQHRAIARICGVPCIGRRRRHHTVTVMWADNVWTGSRAPACAAASVSSDSTHGFDAAFVPGDRSTEYARRLGFSSSAVLTGACTFDEARFASVAAGGVARWTDPRFLFCGRLVPEKAPDVLAEGYRRYRESVASPWPLHVVGHGPFDGGLRTTPGVTVSDFVQPDALPDIFGAAGALILPSRYDPWGVVVPWRHARPVFRSWSPTGAARQTKWPPQAMVSPWPLATPPAWPRHSPR